MPDTMHSASGVERIDFSDEDNGYMQDAGLLERLALAKLDKAADKIKGEGFAWVQCHAKSLGYSELNEYGRMGMLLRNPTEAEQEIFDALDAELSALQQEQEALNDEEEDAQWDALQERMEVTEEKLQAWQESLESPDPEQLAVAGAVVFIGHDGKVKVERGLIKREDMRKAKSSPSEGAGEGMEAGDEVKQKPVHSERLTRMLTAHRTAAIQASLANRPDVALAAIVSQLAGRLFADYRSRSRVLVQINMERPNLKNDAEDIDQSRAVRVIEKKIQSWASRVEAATAETDLFNWLMQQPQEEVLDLLALSVAASVNTVTSREDSPAPEVAHLMNALSLNMADWWEPTAETYLSHVGKDRIIGMVSDAVSPQISQTLSKLKKGNWSRQRRNIWQDCAGCRKYLKRSDRKKDGEPL
jgi:ParB family transcriptional regulator, chromosome partitioning protein